MSLRPYRLPALVLVSLVSCVSSWSQTEKNPQPLEQVYVYADWESPEHRWLDVACDDEIVAKVKAGRFFVIDLPPGRHAMSVRAGIPVFIEVRSGEKSFLRLGREVDGQTVMLVLSKMDSIEANKEMINLAYIDASKALSHSVPKEDPREPRQPQLKTREDRQ